MLLRRAPLAAAGFWDGGYSYLIDEASYVRVLLQGDLVALPTPLAGFRVSDQQWSVRLMRTQAAEAKEFHRELPRDQPGAAVGVGPADRERDGRCDHAAAARRLPVPGPADAQHAGRLTRIGPSAPPVRAQKRWSRRRRTGGGDSLAAIVRPVEQVPSDVATHTISVVIPVYQGERTLPGVVAEIGPLTSEFRTPDGHTAVVTEVLAVYDNGPDDSARVLRELAAAHDFFRPVWLSRNFGQHPATLAGMASSGGDWIVTLDEDGQHDPAQIGRLLDTALRERASVVYAKPTNAAPHGLLRNAASKGAKKFLGGSAGQDASDYQSYPADPRRGRPQRRRLRRFRGVPGRRDGLGRRPDRDLPGRAARGGRPAVRLLAAHA